MFVSEVKLLLLALQTIKLNCYNGESVLFLYLKVLAFILLIIKQNYYFINNLIINNLLYTISALWCDSPSDFSDHYHINSFGIIVYNFHFL